MFFGCTNYHGIALGRSKDGSHKDWRRTFGRLALSNEWKQRLIASAMHLGGSLWENILMEAGGAMHPSRCPPRPRIYWVRVKNITYNNSKMVTRPLFTWVYLHPEKLLVRTSLRLRHVYWTIQRNVSESFIVRK